VNKFFIVLVSVVVLLCACSKANDPYQRETSNLFSINEKFATIGDAIFLDVSNDYVFVAEDQLGFSFFNRNSGRLYHRVSSYNYRDMSGMIAEGQLRSTFMVRFVPELNLLFLSDNSTSGISRFYSWTVDDPNIPADDIELKSLEWMNLIRDMDYELIPDSDDEILVYWSSFTPDFFYRIQKQKHFLNAGIWDPIFERLDFVNIPNETYSIHLTEQYYIAAMGQWGAYVVDRYNFSNHLTTIHIPGQALDVTYKDGYIYVAARQAGLQVIDARNMANARIVESAARNTVGFAQSIDFYGNYLALASSSGGVYIYDISNPENPRQIERWTASDISNANKVQFFDGKLYVATRDRGVLEGVFR
jgi:hypothetical protein